MAYAKRKGCIRRLEDDSGKGIEAFTNRLLHANHRVRNRNSDEDSNVSDETFEGVE